MFCVDKMHRVDYKNLELLRRYLADSSKIESSRKSGTCMKHQPGTLRCFRSPTTM